MKKILRVAAITITLAVIGTTAFAASPDTSKIDNRINRLQQQVQQIESRMQANQSRLSQYTSKMSEYSAFRQDLAQDRITALNNRDENLKLEEENKELRLSLASAIKAIKESGTQLPEETLATLKADNEQIQSLWNDIKDTKGQIKTITQENKTAVKNKDYATIDANFQKIYTIQAWRNDQLKEINTILQQMNSLVVAATSSSPQA